MEVFAFPVSAILALVTVSLVALSGNGRLATFLKSHRTAFSLLAIAALLLMIEGSWAPGIPKRGGFAIFVLLLIFCLGFSATADLKRKCPAALICLYSIF